MNSPRKNASRMAYFGGGLHWLPHIHFHTELTIDFVCDAGNGTIDWHEFKELATTMVSHKHSLKPHAPRPTSSAAKGG